MTRIRILLFAAEISLAYNFVLLLAVSLNYEWVRTRAAGGQFDSFPVGIRVLYFFMAVLMGALMFWLWEQRKGLVSVHGQHIAKFLSITFVLSTVMQLISRSSDERWNAIPASILAITFWVLSRSK